MNTQIIVWPLGKQLSLMAVKIYKTFITGFFCECKVLYIDSKLDTFILTQFYFSGIFEIITIKPV